MAKARYEFDNGVALITLNRDELDEKTVQETVGCVFKYREDLRHLEEELAGKRIELDAENKAGGAQPV